MRVDLNPCFLLHRRPYREGSLLLEVFSRRYGRLGLVARGARRQGKNKQSPLLSFQRLLLSWGGRGELSTLYRREIVEPPIRLDHKAVLAALYQNELLLRLLHRYEAHTGLFDAYDRSLAALAGGNHHDIILRRFEASLLSALGYGPAWDRDARTGEPVQPDHWYDYEMDTGPCRRAVNASEQPVSGRALLWLAGRTDTWDPDSAGQVKILMRRLIDRQLAGRRLASRDLYSDFLRLGRNASHVMSPAVPPRIRTQS